MKKSILEVYALAVCFTAIICFVVALGISIYDFIQIVNPEFTLSSYKYNRHQSNDAFWAGTGDCGSDDKEKQRPNEEELTKKRLTSYQHAIKAERRDAFQSITLASIILAIDTILFLVHWRVAKRARESNVAT